MSNRENSNLALESAGAFLWVVDLAEIKITYSTSINSFFGYDSDVILQEGWLEENTHPDDLVLIKEGLLKFQAGKESKLLFEFRIRNKDGHYHWCRSIGSVRLNHGGKKELAGVTYDISMEKAKEEALQEMQKWFELIAQNTSDGIVVFKDMKIVFVSKSYLGQLGYSEEEEIGRNPETISELMHPEDRHVIGKILEAIGRKEKSLIYVYRVRHKHGHYIWREDLANFFYDENGNYTQAIVVARDVTFRVETTKKLEEAKEKAEEVARLKSSLLNNMSHEFRTPMIGILGFSEMLAESLYDGEQKDWAVNIHKSGTRLMRTLNLLLDYAKWESEATSPGIVSVDPAQVIAQSAELFTHEAKKKGLTLKTECLCDSFKLNTNLRILENVIDNLIDNAIKFTDYGYVSVKAWRNLNDFLIEVRDTGIGITSQQKSVIFEEFRQASEGFGRTHEGAGLGLTLTKLWCEKIGGTISVDSQPGEGSVFTISIPVKESD